MTSKAKLKDELADLKSRKAEVTKKLEANIDALADEVARSASLIEEKAHELVALKERHRGLEAQARRYLDGALNLFDAHVVQFSGARSKTGRSRTALRGKVLDLSGVRTTVSHRFVDGEVILGTLDEARARDLNGKPWEGSSAELVDALWRVEGDGGFYSYTAGRGVKLNPLAVFKDKGHGGLAETGAVVVS